MSAKDVEAGREGSSWLLGLGTVDEGSFGSSSLGCGQDLGRGSSAGHAELLSNPSWARLMVFALLLRMKPGLSLKEEVRML